MRLFDRNVEAPKLKKAAVVVDSGVITTSFLALNYAINRKPPVFGMMDAIQQSFEAVQDRVKSPAIVSAKFQARDAEQVTRPGAQ